MQDERIEHLKSLQNILEQFRNEMSRKDWENLIRVSTNLFLDIQKDGNMTRELAKELGMGVLYREVEK